MQDGSASCAPARRGLHGVPRSFVVTQKCRPAAQPNLRGFSAVATRPIQSA